MTNVRIKTGKPYDVVIGSGILKDIGRTVSELMPHTHTAAIITDSNVGPLYLDQVSQALQTEGLRVISHIVPAGEESKSLTVYSEVLSFLAGGALGRRSVVIALGGGVIGDLAGFAAATYMRGIAVIQIPTSLLAMVDSSVGGKTALNLKEGKNLVGAFYQPRTVLCDIDTLNTLPEETFRDGCAEVIKYGVLASKKAFKHLVKEGLDFDRLFIVENCVAIKGAVVSDDEKEHGVRQMLNLGHTFGHAIEAASGYSVSHGVGVAIGTAMVARAGRSRGYTSEACEEAVTDCLKRFGLPTTTDRTVEELLPYVLKDKKRRGTQINLIVPRQIGDCGIVRVPLGEMEQWIRAGMGGVDEA